MAANIQPQMPWNLEQMDIERLLHLNKSNRQEASSVEFYLSSLHFATKVVNATRFLHQRDVHGGDVNDQLYTRVGRLIKSFQRSSASGYDTYLAILKHLEAAIPVKDGRHEDQLTHLCERLLTRLLTHSRLASYADHVLQRVDVDAVKAKLSAISASGPGMLPAVENELRLHVLRKTTTVSQDSTFLSMILKRLVSPSDRALLVKILHYPSTGERVNWQCFSTASVAGNMPAFRKLSIFLGNVWTHATTSNLCLEKEDILQMVESMIGASANQLPWSVIAMREFLKLTPSGRLIAEMLRKHEYANLARYLEFFRKIDGKRNHFLLPLLPNILRMAHSRPADDQVLNAFDRYVTNQHDDGRPQLMEVLLQHSVLRPGPALPLAEPQQEEEHEEGVKRGHEEDELDEFVKRMRLEPPGPN